MCKIDDCKLACIDLEFRYWGNESLFEVDLLIPGLDCSPESGTWIKLMTVTMIV